MIRGAGLIPKLRFNKVSQLFNHKYHSYPDPSDAPVISKAKSEIAKQLEKMFRFDLHEKFKLDVMFPGTPVSTGISKDAPPKTLSTKLQNGITVASQDMPGMMSSFAVIVRAGSCYETQSGPECDVGATHFLELNGFRSTSTKVHQEIINEVERLGGMVQCLSTRENIIYCIDVLRENSNQALDILADCVQDPSFPEAELEESKMIVQYQQDELPSDVLSKDIVQRAAYLGSPLGNPHYCPLHRLPAIDAKLLHKFRAKFYVGENIVIAGSGIEHNRFVEMVEDKFGKMIRGSRKDIENSRAPSVFTGGIISETRTLKEPFVKLAMAFQVGGWTDNMLVATCVLQQLLGGGSSFSAGGPGKGMYTRLYTRVLNRYHWAESVECFVNINEESGIVGIDGSCPAEHVNEMIAMIVEQFTMLATTPVTDEELNRAKNMLKSMMMMQLESRLVLCEDIARQFVTYGRREMPSDICDKIDATTAEDVMKVAVRAANSLPAIGCVGEDVSYLAKYDAIKQFTNNFRFQEWKKKG